VPKTAPKKTMMQISNTTIQLKILIKQIETVQNSEKKAK
jgi:hypothetical protein